MPPPLTVAPSGGVPVAFRFGISGSTGNGNQLGSPALTPNGVALPNEVVLSSPFPVPPLTMKYQPLPDEPYIQMQGSFGPSSSGTIYKLPLDPETAGLWLDIRSHDPRFPDAVEVFDDAGHILISKKTEPGGLLLDLNVGTLDASGSSAIYLMISPILSGNAIPPSLSSSAYTLEILRQAKPESSSSAGQPVTEGSGVSASAGNNLPAAQQEQTAGQEDEGDGEGTLVAASTGGSGIMVGAPTVVAVGPLPRRSAAPLGGVLAEGDPAPTVDPESLAKIDLDLLLSPRRGGAPEDVDALAALQTEDEAETADGLVSLRGPGGIPLLATALIATPHTPGSYAEANPPSWAHSVDQQPPCAIQTPEPAGDTRVSTARSSVANAMSLALSLLCGVVLPDVAAAGTPGRKAARRTRLARLIRWARRGII